jgi:lysyl-tRNA synthetase class 2
MLQLATDAVGTGWLSESRANMAGFLIGLLATFLLVRINTRLIRARVSWWFHDIESEGGTHVHHMVIGVVLMVTVGILFIALAPQDLLSQLLALLFGAGVALTLDEFALILNLQDVYWRKEGRLSVDAVIIVVCVAALFVLGLDPFGALSSPDLSGGVFRLAFALWFCIVILPVALCLFKGKIWTGVIGLFVPSVAIIGAVRLARLNSPWARRRYAKNPKKLARAERREARLDARWIAWRDAFFDLIAGKPHLPSLPPLGPDGLPVTAVNAAADPPDAEQSGEEQAGDGETATGAARERESDPPPEERIVDTAGGE